MGQQQNTAVARHPLDFPQQPDATRFDPGREKETPAQITQENVERQALNTAKAKFKEQTKPPAEKVLEDAGKLGKQFTDFLGRQINKVTDIPGQALDTTQILVIGAVILGAVIVMNVDVAALV